MSVRQRDMSAVPTAGQKLRTVAKLHNEGPEAEPEAPRVTSDAFAVLCVITRTLTAVPTGGGPQLDQGRRSYGGRQTGATANSCCVVYNHH